MDILTGFIIGLVIYAAYKFGQLSQRRAIAEAGIADVIQRASIPVAVAEKIEDQYYVYEKDSTNFLCQAKTLEDIPMSLWENKKISLAVVMCPEEANDQIFWCLNGKLKIVQQ